MVIPSLLNNNNFSLVSSTSRAPPLQPTINTAWLKLINIVPVSNTCLKNTIGRQINWPTYTGWHNHTPWRNVYTPPPYVNCLMVSFHLIICSTDKTLSLSSLPHLQASGGDQASHISVHWLQTVANHISLQTQLDPHCPGYHSCATQIHFTECSRLFPEWRAALSSILHAHSCWTKSPICSGVGSILPWSDHSILSRYSG